MRPRTVESLERDLLDCGVPIFAVRPLSTRYVRALASRADLDWIELYVGIFATVLRGMHATHKADASAAERIVLLMNDDLGRDLFDASARAQLALALQGAAA